MALNLPRVLGCSYIPVFAPCAAAPGWQRPLLGNALIAVYPLVVICAGLLEARLAALVESAEWNGRPSIGKLPERIPLPAELVLADWRVGWR